MRNPLGLVSSALLAVCLASGCTDGVTVDAPDPNPAITNTFGEAQQPRLVECEGPADELALLGALCGADTGTEALWDTDAAGAGMATAIGPYGASLVLVYSEVDEPGSADVRHAAYVLVGGFDGDGPAEAQWRSAEPVTSGAVTTNDLLFDVACTVGWAADAELLWRGTTIRLSWAAAKGC